MMICSSMPKTDPVTEYCGFSAIIYAGFFFGILLDKSDSSGFFADRF
ncbi:hypothetical protein RKD52_002407 [Metabacillus sp. SLBN-84]